ncbi:UNKNOWN [Stylonychia lemnae]|uniref:Uncharacterized protein n=1 Tax=Stylonychia lemnae TaxID=5949 RepID=A0A078A311_STYLE|nr:UNKNOWN [Stylonychia lemnae]|eukprot:CDW76668.1 UNKNOWN [Stylonychia lemnae]
MNEELNQQQFAYNQQNSKSTTQHMSHHSKVTSIIRRRTKDLDEEDELINSQSSQTNIGRLEGLINTQLNQQNQQFITAADQTKQTDKNTTIDMNFLHDINNECSYLITKFQQEQYVSTRGANDQRRKSGDLRNSRIIEGTGSYTNQSKILSQDKSNKTVGPIQTSSNQNIQPLTVKNGQRGNHQQYTSKEDNFSSNMNTINQKYASAAISDSNESERIRSGDYGITTYEQQSMVQNKQNIHIESSKYFEDRENSIIANVQEKRFYEEGSIKYVSSYHPENHSKFSISDRNSQIADMKGHSSFQPPNFDSNKDLSKVIHTSNNKLTFRNDDFRNDDSSNNKAASSNEKQAYFIPNDEEEQSVDPDEPPVNQYQISNNMHEPQAQFDLQNFQAFDDNKGGYTIPQDEDNNDEYEQDYEDDDVQQQREENAKGQLLFTNNQHIFNHVDSEPQLPNVAKKFMGSDYEDEPPKFPTQLDDNVIYNRLPKNFFVQEEEDAKDMNQVLSSIQQMREDFMGYISENNIQKKLDEISNIIEPEKFIQKHFGEEDPSEMLFDKVISTRKGSNKMDDDKSSQRLDDKSSNLKATILEEDLESSPDRISKDKTPISTKREFILASEKQKIRSQRESARQVKIKGAKHIVKPPDSSVYTVGANYPIAGPRQIKMADYFRENQIKPQLDIDVLNATQMLDKTQIMDDEEEDQIYLNDDEKQKLKERMEQDILANIDINFLFNKGEQLRFGLIDQKKAYKLMLKIKEVASQQFERGRKEIDYNEIVKYLKDQELYEDDNLKLDGDLKVHPNSEPIQTKVVEKEVFTYDHWRQVLDFMRKNPKLLMQMLPDTQDDDYYYMEPAQKNKNKLHQQIEEAKRFSRLQALNAIDHQQNQKFPSPPKNNAAKERKLNNYNKTGTNKTIDKKKNTDGNKELKSPLNARSTEQLASGSDSENGQAKQKNKSFQKQFQYNSASVAKNIYSNAPFNHPDLQSQPLSKLENYNQVNSGRPVQSQQQTRGKSLNKILNKKGSVMSTMGDHTTIGTTTGNITNLNNYKQQNVLSSQHQTIEEGTGGYSKNNTGVGVFSMLNNYNTQDGNIGKDQNSQRRPITASAAQEGSTRSLAYMKPILQQRQESFDVHSNNQAKNSRGGGSISKNSYPRRKYGGDNASDAGNNSAIQNYASMGGVLDNSYNNINTNLNSSFAGNVIGKTFAPINLGPSKKTQKFIHKIAPNLKENELYNKMINEARLNSKDPGMRYSSNDGVRNQIKLGQFHKVGNVDSRRNAALNQSGSNFKMNEYEQTPQGAFPKFIKGQNTQSSARQEPNQSSNQSIQSKYNKFVTTKQYADQNMQTRIIGVNNKLIISPQNASTDPFYHDGISQISRQDSQVSEKFNKKYVKIPVIDWAYTQLFTKAVSQDIEFNKEGDINIYIEKEVDYCIDMMKNKYKDFKRSDIIRPFYLKALQTLQILLSEQSLGQIFEKTCKKYKEITIENTMKLLIRCKLAFHARGMILDILNAVINYEMIAVELKKIIDQHQKYKVSVQQYDEIHQGGKKVFDQGHELLVRIKTLKSVHKQFKNPFIFKKKDYVNYVKSEMNEIRKLISIFQIQGLNDGIPEPDIILRKIEENKNETEEQSYQTTEENVQNNLGSGRH